MEYSTSSEAANGSSMDVDMVEEPAIDMGYEDHAPMPRRSSMSHAEEKQRRASIKAIMADRTISPMAKRRSIQHLMDGRRNSMSAYSGSSGSSHGGSTASNSCCDSDSEDTPAGAAGTGDNGSSQPKVFVQVNFQEGTSDNDRGAAAAVLDPNLNKSGSMLDAFFLCNEQTKRAEQTRPPCPHYERNCTLISPCCGAAFGCRICHDDCPVLPPKVSKRRYARSASLPGSFTSMGPKPDPDDTHHTIDRFAVREVICRNCYTRQSSKANKCVSCGIQFGEYHCSVCNLWMSNEERPYHCPDCGFCRVGGAENFLHCHDCGMCIDKSLYDNHNCKAGKYRSNCPVCQEYLFSSRSASHEMPCGHAIHWDCFRQLAAHDSRCPVCKKTAETRERMMPTWQAMAAGVALQPVPPELARVVNITCNDCEKSEKSRAWHFLGVQCRNCQSFNTVIDQLVLSGEEAHVYLERNDPGYRQGGAHHQFPQGYQHHQQQQRQQQQQQQQGQQNSSRQNGPPRRRRMNRRRSAF